MDSAKVFVAMAKTMGMEEFLAKLITMDKTMVSFLTSNTKEQSKEWRQKGSPAPPKAKDLEARTARD